MAKFVIGSSKLAALGYINTTFENLKTIAPHQVEALYHDLKSSGVIIPSGEGRSKGALSVACSEMAKMTHGKIVIDRADIGFPGRDPAEAAPILKRRYGQVCLLINSGSGKSLVPLLDAQKLAFYIATVGQERDFRIDLVTSDPESPLGKLSMKYGNMVLLKGREPLELPPEPREFRTHGIMEDMFTLGSGLLFQSMVEVMAQEAPVSSLMTSLNSLCDKVGALVDEMIASEFFTFVLDYLEQRKPCFFAGLGSSQEVARMTAVRVGHVKRAIGDNVHVAGEANTPAPRSGDLLVVVSNSGENEIVAGWCRNFKKMGGKIAAIVGTPSSTIASLADVSFVTKSEVRPGMPNSFYIKTAFTLSPLPIYLIEGLEEKGLKLPEYILHWHRSIIS